jgi:hypothetical protein
MLSFSRRLYFVLPSGGTMRHMRGASSRVELSLRRHVLLVSGADYTQPRLNQEEPDERHSRHDDTINGNPPSILMCPRLQPRHTHSPE